jgi:thioesterase domain-containing protein
MDIYSNPTASSLLQKILARKKYPYPSWITTLNAKGDKSPLFLIHPSLTVGTDYINLIIEDEKQPIFAISNPYFGAQDETKQNFSSISDMVQLYSETICGILKQNSSSIKLGGWCFGGFVALEIAKYFQKQGKIKVEVVILIDTFNIPSLFLEKFVENLGHTKNNSVEDEALKMLWKYDNDDKVRYDGPVVLLKAKELRENEEENEIDDPDMVIMKSKDNGWLTLYPDIKCYSVPGNNDTLLDFPNVETFSKVFFKALRERKRNNVS